MKEVEFFCKLMGLCSEDDGKRQSPPIVYGLDDDCDSTICSHILAESFNMVSKKNITRN